VERIDKEYAQTKGLPLAALICRFIL